MNLTFVYEESWLGRPQSFPISRSLPFREDAYEGRKVFAFFDNLLPDGVSIRQRIAARMHAESDEVFDLLSVVGRDCVGALQFMRRDEPAPLLEKAVGTPLKESEIASKLRNLGSSPLAVSDEEDFRLSLAGAQEKTAFLYLNGKWQSPHGATPTTHIFKPQTGELKPGLSFSDSVENEWLCAQIVREYGISVAECEIKSFEDIKVLIVKRFDRAWSGTTLIRIPQEDMCQALGVPNFEKYENEGGPGITAIMNLLLEANSPEKDRRTFLKSQIIFYILAGIDGHAKNFSLRWGPPGFELTPLYDILSAHPMLAAKKFQIEKLKMAMAFGKNRHYILREISRRHFLETAKLCKYDQKLMETLIDETLEQTDGVIQRVRDKLSLDFPSEIAEVIFSGMMERSKHLGALSSLT